MFRKPNTKKKSNTKMQKDNSLLYHEREKSYDTISNVFSQKKSAKR